MTDREVVRCPHCTLSQFMTVSGSCRKCRGVLNAPKMMPTSAPIEALVTPKLSVVQRSPRVAPAQKPKQTFPCKPRPSGCYQQFKAGKTLAERRAIISWYLSNKNGTYVPAAL